MKTESKFVKVTDHFGYKFEKITVGQSFIQCYVIYRIKNGKPDYECSAVISKIRAINECKHLEELN